MQMAKSGKCGLVDWSFSAFQPHRTSISRNVHCSSLQTFRVQSSAIVASSNRQWFLALNSKLEVHLANSQLNDRDIMPDQL